MPLRKISHKQWRTSSVAPIQEKKRLSPTNSGGNNLKGVQDYQDHDFKADMAAFDKLGPLTRKVLNYDMVVEWDCVRTLNTMGHMSDRESARMLLQNNERIKPQIREMYENPD